MSLLTKAGAKALLQSGDTPTETDFANIIDSLVFTPTTLVSGNSIVVVEGTVSSTTRRIGAVGVALVSARTTSNALDTLGLSSIGQALVGQGTTASAQTVLGGGAVGRTVFEAGTTASAQTVMGGGTVGRAVFEQGTTASAQTVMGGGAVGRAVFESGTTASAQTVMGGRTVGRILFESNTTASAANQLAVGAANIAFVSRVSGAAVGSIQVSGMAAGNDYWVSMNHMAPGTEDVALCIRMLVAGTTAAASADYRWASTMGGTLSSDVDEDKIRFVFNGVSGNASNSAARSGDYEIFVANPMSTNIHNVGGFGAMSDTNGNPRNVNFSGTHASAVAVSAMEFFPASGNWGAIGELTVRSRNRTS